MTGYDVIGDVHGCADKLVGLLRQLGYREQAGAWRHPGRLAIFVGDLIDRGPQQVETVELVRRMVDSGTARMVMGNHEFNAISWATEDPSEPGEFMRTHHGRNGAKHRAQHARFLAAVGEQSAMHDEFIAWFTTLPMWMDLDGLRVVHACWHDASIDALPDVSGETPMTDEFVIEANRKGTKGYDAVEVSLKGPEVELGDHRPFLDKDGHRRTAARIRWWDAEAVTLRQLAEIPPGSNAPDGEPYPELPDEPCDAAEEYRYQGETPVVFGHYWRTESSVVLGHKAVCVDFSAVKHGPLVAYRWDGETSPTASNFHAFGSE